MKNRMLILALSLALTAITAKAGNEGPQAEPQPPIVAAKVIAQVTMSGGLFIPPQAPTYKEINILNTGAVEVVYSYRDGRTETLQLAILDGRVLSKITDLVNSVQPGDLVDYSPDTPSCLDAPFFRYLAVPEKGEKIPVAEWAGCKDLHNEQAGRAGYTLKDILDGLSALENTLSLY